MNVKRDRLGIINDILEIVRDRGGKVKPTQIMYKANLSHDMMISYINELLAKQFIKETVDRKEKRTYALLDKGYNFLRDYKIIRGLADSYDLNE